MNSHSPSNSRVILTIETIGREPVLRSQEIEGILGAVGVDTASWVRSSGGENIGFAKALNGIVDEFLARKMETKHDRSERNKLKRMRSYLEDYMKAASALKHSSYPPPYLPKKWYDQTMEFYDELFDTFDERTSGGRKEAIPEWEFIGKCAALFSLAFNIRPTSSVPGVRPESGAFSKFLIAINVACRQRLLAPSSAKYSLPDEFRHHVFLVGQSDEQLRKIIGKALSYQKQELPENERSEERVTYWQSYIKLIKDVYVCDDCEPKSL